MNESQKFVRWTVLFCILLAGFASPFSPTSCSVEFAVGFPLPYYFTGISVPAFVWPISRSLSIISNILTVLILSAVFWRLQAKLVNRPATIAGLRFAVIYGLVSTLICLLFSLFNQSNADFSNAVEVALVFPAYVFYLPLFFLEEWLHFTEAEGVMYARVLLLPTLALWTFLFAGLTVLVKKIVRLFRPKCENCPS